MPNVDVQPLRDAYRSAFAFLKSKTEDVPDQQAVIRPAPDRWSVLENLEHVLIVDERLRTRIATAVPGTQTLGDSSREETMVHAVVAREGRFQAPEVVHPKGRFSSVSDVLAALEESIAQDIAVARERADVLRYLPFQHPVFGVLSCWEGMLIAAAHIRRHANQIVEVKEQLHANALSAPEDGLRN